MVVLSSEREREEEKRKNEVNIYAANTRGVPHTSDQLLMFGRLYQIHNCLTLILRPYYQ